MKLPRIRHSYLAAQYQPLQTEETSRVTLKKERAIERWSKKDQGGKPIHKFPVSAQAQRNQIAALGNLPLSVRHSWVV